MRELGLRGVVRGKPIPPAEYEDAYYRYQESSGKAAETQTKRSLHETQPARARSPLPDYGAKQFPLNR